MELDVQNISFAYTCKKVLKQVSFKAESGDMIALIGQNGSGKSTLLKCMARILKIGQGVIQMDGHKLQQIPADHLSRLLAYIPQMEEYIAHVKVFDAVLLGRKPYIAGTPSERDMEVVSQLLRRLDLEEFAMQDLHTLSGGQQQRVFIARALAQKPSILLLDEPVANLDICHQMRVMRLLQQLAAEGLLVIMTIHDINLAARFCNKVLMLKNGELFASGVQSAYTPENIKMLYEVDVEVINHKNMICIIPY